MTKLKSAKGNCLCGAVCLKVNSMSLSIGACHCAMCRKWGGGPLITIDCGSDVEISNREKISVFESSDWAERAFCTSCGSHLYYRLKQNNVYIISVGLFELDNEFIFDHQIFIDQKPNYYCFANKTKEMTGEEVFELYASE